VSLADLFDRAEQLRDHPLQGARVAVRAAGALIRGEGGVGQPLGAHAEILQCVLLFLGRHQCRHLISLAQRLDEEVAGISVQRADSAERSDPVAQATARVRGSGAAGLLGLGPQGVATYGIKGRVLAERAYLGVLGVDQAQPLGGEAGTLVGLVPLAVALCVGE
jgi:hypothetical protein